MFCGYSNHSVALESLGVSHDHRVEPFGRSLAQIASEERMRRSEILDTAVRAVVDCLSLEPQAQRAIGRGRVRNLQIPIDSPTLLREDGEDGSVGLSVGHWVRLSLSETTIPKAAVCSISERGQNNGLEVFHVEVDVAILILENPILRDEKVERGL